MAKSPRNDQQRLYRDLAWVWPIISPPEDYIEETALFSKTIREHAGVDVKTVLNLGCGGGHNDYALKKYFAVTGVDISEVMLARARELNPEAKYHPGDMRTVRLGKTFDAVTIFDSINYMLTVEDLRAVFSTAFRHLRRGGVLLTLVEQTPERFQQSLTNCTRHTREDTDIVFIANVYDPDPGDTTYEATFVYLIRRRGRLRVVTDRHICGIFGLETWLGVLKEAGFEVNQMEFKLPGPEGDRYPMLVCVKPGR